MKYVKMLGLAAIAAMALMAFAASSASATTLDNENGVMPAGSTILASLEPGTSAVLTDTSGNPLDTCTESTVHGVTEQETSSPASSIKPLVGSSKPAIIRSVVVLPEPEGPSIVKNSPGATSRSIPATATTSP